MYDINEPTMVFLGPEVEILIIAQYAKSQNDTCYMTKIVPMATVRVPDIHVIKVYTPDGASSVYMMKFGEFYQFTANAYHYALHDVNNLDKWKNETLKCRMKYSHKINPWV